MKIYLLSAFLLASASVLASEIPHAVLANRSVQAVRVNSVTQTRVGGHGDVSVRVRARATFGNPCKIPRPGELIKIVRHENQFRDLTITLGEEVLRACPQHVAPQSIIIDLGTFSKPNDGVFDKITVNGVEAR